METDKSELLSHYATKADLQGVRVEVQAVLGEVRTLRAEMATLRADLFQALNSQAWKTIGMIVASNAVMITFGFYMING